jgi:hypothetical protein
MESPEAINLLGDLSDAEKIAFRKWLVLSDMIKRRPIVTVEMWLLGLLTTMRQHLLTITASATRQKAFVEEEEELLPCHYFDFMYGTSTGGLIATTMLGRLRMTTTECPIS